MASYILRQYPIHPKHNRFTTILCFYSLWRYFLSYLSSNNMNSVMVPRMLLAFAVAVSHITYISHTVNGHKKGIVKPKIVFKLFDITAQLYSLWFELETNHPKSASNDGSPCDCIFNYLVRITEVDECKVNIYGARCDTVNAWTSVVTEKWRLCK